MQGPLACVPAIDRYLDDYTRTRALPGNLKEAVRYALLGGGKRLRPVLAWHSCEALGAPGEKALHAGAAVELIHAFSLVHDDLPAMDDDDLRRGQPTLHVRSGEAMAILAGDAMMALAFGILAKQSETAEQAAALIRELAASATGMIVGQVYDTLGGLPAVSDREKLDLIHGNKTGALIRGACRMGGICAGADGGALEALTRYGEALGLMFQVVDDLLDAEGTPEHTGKRTRKDAPAGKLTSPAVLGIEGSRREVDRLLNLAVEAVEPLSAPAAGLRELARMLADRRN